MENFFELKECYSPPVVRFPHQINSMRTFFLLALLAKTISPVFAQQRNFESYPIYEGSDLGLTYSPAQSTFRIWSPPANNAQLLLFSNGNAGKNADLSGAEIVEMQRAENGTWKVTLPGDLKGRFYAFRVHVDGQWSDAVTDPYARATGVNGRRAMVFDADETNPPGWKDEKAPAFENKTDAIIYELHVRDASIAANSGITHKGKFLGLAEKGTRNSEGLATGIDHIRDLGVTHVHLLPVFDFLSVDETRLNEPQYNWGYEPMNFNVPEGSYATDPYDGRTRIREFKEMVKAMHENGLRVVMDVVYNHTMLTEKSNFNQLVPGYYYRQAADGSFSNATACGNEMASERGMVRKFMLESMKYWVEEYHIDGFRVDLMGVHDIETMNRISRELHRIRPDILIYGEGWTAGASPLPDSLRALKVNVAKLDSIAVFSDDMRDGIKGSVFINEEKGFASGGKGKEESIKFGIVASLPHAQVDYSLVNYSKAPYSAEPWQTVNYAECHDNHVLWDKLALSSPGASLSERKKMHRLALAIVLTSQGIPFLHAGGEFLRTKHGHENSYDAGDSVNAIDWELKTKNVDVFEYVKALVKLRKDQPIFRLQSAEEIRSTLQFEENLPEGLVAYTITNENPAPGEWSKALVCFNGRSKKQGFRIPKGKWSRFIRDNQLADGRQRRRKLSIDQYSCTILYQ